MAKKTIKKREGHHGAKGNYFDCPCCGNMLFESVRDTIRCKYCSALIVPKSQKIGRNSELIEMPAIKERQERG